MRYRTCAVGWETRCGDIPVRCTDWRLACSGCDREMAPVGRTYPSYCLPSNDLLQTAPTTRFSTCPSCFSIRPNPCRRHQTRFSLSWIDPLMVQTLGIHSIPHHPLLPLLRTSTLINTPTWHMTWRTLLWYAGMVNSPPFLRVGYARNRLGLYEHYDRMVVSTTVPGTMVGTSAGFPFALAACYPQPTPTANPITILFWNDGNCNHRWIGRDDLGKGLSVDLMEEWAGVVWDCGRGADTRWVEVLLAG